MKNQQLLKLSKITACICYYILYANNCNAQQLTMSSMGMLNNTTNLSAAMNFKSTTNCIDVQSGIANYSYKATYGEFAINCNIDQKINTLGLKLFPNPVISNIKIKFSNTPPLNENFKLTICNSEGIIMHILNTNGYQLFQGHVLNVTDLTSGTYIIKIESPQFIEALKFIKIN
jgi:hypothetical protein